VLRQEWNRELARLTDLKAGLEEAQDVQALQTLQTLENSALARGLEERFSGDGADFDALLQADRELLEFKVSLDDLSAKVAWPASIKESENWLTDLDRLVGQHGTGDEKSRARTLREQIRAIIAEKNEDRLRKKMDEISDVYSSILYRQSSFWVEYFEMLGRSQPQMRDPDRATELLAHGRDHIAADELDQLKEVVFQLQDMLPKRIVEQARRGYGSGLVT
jgi:molecular chaperone DnaK